MRFAIVVAVIDDPLPLGDDFIAELIARDFVPQSRNAPSVNFMILPWHDGTTRFLFSKAYSIARRQAVWYPSEKLAYRHTGIEAYLFGPRQAFLIEKLKQLLYFRRARSPLDSDVDILGVSR